MELDFWGWGVDMDFGNGSLVCLDRSLVAASLYRGWGLFSVGVFFGGRLLRVLKYWLVDT